MYIIIVGHAALLLLIVAAALVLGVDFFLQKMRPIEQEASAAEFFLKNRFQEVDLSAPLLQELPAP